jgi:hypothetical protein
VPLRPPATRVDKQSFAPRQPSAPMCCESGTQETIETKRLACEISLLRIVITLQCFRERTASVPGMGIVPISRPASGKHHHTT